VGRSQVLIADRCSPGRSPASVLAEHPQPALAGGLIWLPATGESWSIDGRGGRRADSAGEGEVLAANVGKAGLVLVVTAHEVEAVETAADEVLDQRAEQELTG
jgi:hypothetical protein